MYGFLLVLHNLLRWFVLLAGGYACVRAVLGWAGRRPWVAADQRAGAFFAIGMDLQFLSGLALLLVSPVFRAVMANFGSALRNADLRFFPALHLPVMIAALGLAHLGRAQARRAADPLGQHRRTTLWFAASLLMVLLATPWWRPLLRGG